MKPMSDKKMDMNSGSVKSEPFFPEEAKHKSMPRVGQIRNMKYPDTEETVYAESEQFVRDTNKNMPKPGYRH